VQALHGLTLDQQGNVPGTEGGPGAAS
jgi:hypothetical protein